MAAPLKAGGQILCLLFLLVPSQDFDWIVATVRGRIGVRDSNIEDCRGAASPESMDGDVASSVGCCLYSRCSGCLHAPTCID